jgi:hypothetical protein
MPNDRVVAAVNYLIASDDYSTLIGQMTRIIEGRPPRPAQFMGDAACLNALVEVGIKSREAFEKVLALVERKRLVNPKVAKREYQKVIMRERRKRMAKALVLHEARSGPLRGEDRASTMAAIRRRWEQARAQFLASQEVMSGEERLVAIRQFWATLDRQLDANLADLHKTRAVA